MGGHLRKAWPKPSHQIHRGMAVARHDDGLCAHPGRDGDHTLPTSIRGPKTQANWSNERLNRNRGQDGTESGQ